MAVRIANREDVPAMLAIYGPYVEQTAISFEYEVPTLAAFSARFDRITRQFPWLVWEEDGRILGYAYADAPFERAAFQWCAEPSVYLLPQARGRGIGRALYEALEKTLYAQGYRVLYAVVTDSNADSIAFHKALGYSRLAGFPDCGFKSGCWYGIVWLEKRLHFVEMPTDKPLPFWELVKNNQK